MNQYLEEKRIPSFLISLVVNDIQSRYEQKEKKQKKKNLMVYFTNNFNENNKINDL